MKLLEIPKRVLLKLGSVTSEEQAYIREQLATLGQTWITTLAMLTIGLFLSFSVFDYVMSPDYFYRFLPHRFGISVFLLVFVVLNRFRKGFFYYQVLVSTAIAGIAGTIELITLSFNDHGGFYHNGMILAVIGTLGFMPLTPAFSLAVIGIIYGTLIGAVIIFAPAQLHSFPFLMVNAYLLATCAMCFVIRVTHQKSLINMFRFQYHVEQENQSLQKLSDQLKQVVDNQSLEIEKSELMLNTLLDNASDGVIIMSGEGRIIAANPSACKLYGYASSQLVGKKIATVAKSNDTAFWERRLAYLKRDPHLLFEIDHVRDDNARVICEVSANRIQIGDVDVVLALYRDLSERRKMQEQLLLSQKMESIGTLSCGIAHDFRNVLATVQTFCDFIRTIKQDGPYCPAHESVVSSADLMEGELLRASEMLRKLLSFGGKTALEMSPVDVNAAVDDVVGLYSKVSKAVRFHIAVDNSVPLVNADRGSIDQALMNLIVNAAEATPKGGTVTVKTSVRFLRADEYRPASYSMENGLKKFIEIEISDTGIGIRPDVLAHIFEPFYTTKTNSPRSGTGLGLAIVYFVVKEHGGVVKVESKVGVGTTFRVYLPVSGSPEDMLAALPGDSNKGREERRGRVQG